MTWPGLVTLYRSRTSTPAWSSRAKNSSALAAAAAAVDDVAAQRDPGRLAAPVAGGFAGLGAGRGAGRGAVGRGGGPQPVPLLGGQAGVADPVPLVHDPGAGPVLAGQHRHQVDVVRAVPDRDPPHRVVFLPARAQPGAVHHIARRCRPTRASESSRSSGAARIEQCQTGLAYPHLPSASCGSRSSPARRRKSRLPSARSGGSRSDGRPVAGDDVRVGVFLPASGAVQVADQPGHVLAARADLPDHRSPGPRLAAERHPVPRNAIRSAFRATRNAIRAVAAGAERRPVILDRRKAARILVRPAGGVARVRGWPGGIWSAGLPRPLPAGPRGAPTLPRTRGRSPDHCPVAFSFATAWFKFTPIRRTPSAARSRAYTASRSGASGVVTAPRATRQGGFGRVRAARQPGLPGGGRHLGVLLLGQREPHRAGSPRLMPGPAARPGTGPPVVVTSLVIAENVRHEPFPFSPQSPARMRREFPALSPAGLISVCTLDRARSKRK